MSIAVAGGSGVVGRHVVEVARERGHEVVVLTRSTGVDLTTGDGLDERLTAVDAVVDVTSVATQDAEDAATFFRQVTTTLLAAEAEAGVGHHVVLSIVGIDEVPTGYYRGKLAHEAAVRAGGVPWTILRATQFHEFAEQVLHFARIGPFSLVPAMLSQPVAAREVAEALVDLAEAGPAGRVPDLAGPERHRMASLARGVSRARGRGRVVVPVLLPTRASWRASRGALVPATDGPRGTTTFAEWLARG